MARTPTAPRPRPPGKSVVDPDLAARLRSYVGRVGERAALEYLGIQRLTLARAAAGLGNHRATLAYIAARLDAVPPAPKVTTSTGQAA